MLSNPMLDVAIGLIFLYLLLSIVVTVLQEFISSSLRLRNANLVRGIAELVGKAPEDKRAFFEHPLIVPLFRGEVDPTSGIPLQPPAYIPRRNFALAILDLQSRREAKRVATEKLRATLPMLPPATGLREAPAANDALAPPPDDAGADGARLKLLPAFALAAFFEDVESGVGLSSRLTKFGTTATSVIGKIENEAVQKAAAGALAAAVGELKTATDVVDTAVKELESLFDSTMDRAAGWYKVNAQRIAFVIGVLVALLLNVDTIHVGKQLWSNEELRNRAAATAEGFYASAAGQQQLHALCQTEATGTSTSTGAPDDTTALTHEQWSAVKDCTEREIREATSRISEVGYPIGWTGWEGGLPKGQPSQNLGWAVVGILITGLALSLGASFWFDLLGKFMNVRMTGKKEQTATTEFAGSGSK